MSYCLEGTLFFIDVMGSKLFIFKIVDVRMPPLSELVLSAHFNLRLNRHTCIIIILRRLDVLIFDPLKTLAQGLNFDVKLPLTFFLLLDKLD